jgi:hypothetical protein
MSVWNRERVEQLIKDQVEEHLSLDYKAAGALEKNDKKRIELTKDVSAIANSSGGLLIYGVFETEHVPGGFDPVKRSVISKEWIEQVIQTIQPRIDGIFIHAISLSPDGEEVCYVVDVPKSTTAHMAQDQRYYKRFNFTSCPMQDYEVRDVMNRRTHPHVKASIFVNRNTNRIEQTGVILVKVENVGSVMARHIMAELEMPISFDGDIVVDSPVTVEEGESGRFYRVKISPGLADPPLFPGAAHVLRRSIKRGQLKTANGQPLESIRHIKVTIYADAMAPLSAILDFGATTIGWVPVQ